MCYENAENVVMPTRAQYVNIRHVKYCVKMILLCFLLGLLLVPLESTAYVLLQVRRQNDNYSNVDALIHKVVPSAQFDKFAERMARKRPTASTGEEPQKSGPKKSRTFKNVLSAMNLEHVEPKEPNFQDLVLKAAKRFTKNSSGPILRSKSQNYLIRPERVNLRSGTSSVYNIDTETIAVAVKDILSSTALREYLDSLSKTAAAVSKTIEIQFLKKPQTLLYY